MRLTPMAVGRDDLGDDGSNLMERRIDLAQVAENAERNGRIIDSLLALDPP